MNAVARALFPRGAGVLGLVLLGGTANGADPSDFPAVARTAGEAQAVAGEVMQVIHGAVGRAPTAADFLALQRESLGASLGEYASNPGADPDRYESTRLAARRILAEGATNRQSPDQSARWLADAASRLEALAAADPELNDEEHRDLRRQAHLARFHAERLIAAVRYNLFRRGLSLAELYAATLQEKRAITHWRALVASAGAHPCAALWRDELNRMETRLRDLESECCPPTREHLAGLIWQPPGS